MELLEKIFDKIVYLNAPWRADRNERMIATLEAMGINNYERFESIPDTTAARSFNVSSMAILQKFVTETDARRLLLLEDDAEPTKEYYDSGTRALAACMAHDPEFDLLYLGANLYKFPFVRAARHVIRLSGAFTTHAVGYSKKAALKILSGFDPHSDVYDNWLATKFHTDKKNFCYMTDPLLVIQRESWSDLENRITGYEESWKLTRKRLNESLRKSRH